jgi:hypothetical protein
MTTKSTAVPGFVGGFAESNPEFAYPDPNLSSLPILDNMANINKLQRQQEVKWPEFSWNTRPDETDKKRCYQQFATDISRLGYTNTGRVYSIICPQQGFVSKAFGALNVEVTVTGQRGWVNETEQEHKGETNEQRTSGKYQELAADMNVIGKIWFSPSAHQKPLVKLLSKHFADSDHPFPSDKAHAIEVLTHKVGEPNQPYFPLRSGESDDFPIPEFAKHNDKAWAVGNLGVQIGEIHKTGDKVTDAFNELIMDVFNLGSGNMLAPDNVLTWNVWFTPPTLVDTTEWANHAQVWRAAIDADHGPKSEPARYYDGSKFELLENAEQVEHDKLIKFLEEHLPFGGELFKLVEGFEKVEHNKITDFIKKHLHL